MSEEHYGASPVTITRADGTVYTQPAYDANQLTAIQRGKGGHPWIQDPERANNPRTKKTEEPA